MADFSDDWGVDLDVFMDRLFKVSPLHLFLLHRTPIRIRVRVRVFLLHRTAPLIHSFMWPFPNHVAFSHSCGLSSCSYDESWCAWMGPMMMSMQCLVLFGIMGTANYIRSVVTVLHIPALDPATLHPHAS